MDGGRKRVLLIAAPRSSLNHFQWKEETKTVGNLFERWARASTSRLSEVERMPQGDLETGLLLDIMKRIGEFRGKRPGWPLQTGEIMDLVPSEMGSGQVRLTHLDRHVDFLREVG